MGSGDRRIDGRPSLPRLCRLLKFLKILKSWNPQWSCATSYHGSSEDPIFAVGIDAVVKEGKRHALAGPISRPFHGSQTVGKGDIVAARPYASGYGHRCKQSGYEHDGSRDAGKNQSHGTSVGIIASDTSRKGRPGLNRETAGARKKGCRRQNGGPPRHSRHRYTHGKNDIEKTPTRRDKRWEKQ